MNIDEAFRTKNEAELIPNPVPVTAIGVVGTFDSSQLESSRNDVIESASALMIVDQVTFELAGTFLTDQIKPMQKLIHESCDPVCDATNTAHKAATGQRKTLLDPLEKAEGIVKDKIGAWVMEQARVRKIEEDRIEAERLKAEKEREEAQAKADQDAADALKRAEDLEKAGDVEGAAAALEEATQERRVYIEEPIQPPPIASPALTKSKASGISTRMEYIVEVTSLQAFLQGICDRKTPASVVTVNLGDLKKKANAMDGVLDYPGIKITSRPVVSARAK